MRPGRSKNKLLSPAPIHSAATVGVFQGSHGHYWRAELDVCAQARYRRP